MLSTFSYGTSYIQFCNRSLTVPRGKGVLWCTSWKTYNHFVIRILTWDGITPEEIRTRVVRAAGFATVVRRAAFAIFTKKNVDSKIIARDVAMLNKTIFEELVKRGIKKEDYIRITVEGEYDEEKQEIVWKNLVVERFIPESDLKELTLKYEELKKEVERLRKENSELKERLAALGELEKVKEEVERLKRELSQREEELNKLRKEHEELKAERKRLKNENLRLRGALRTIIEVVRKVLESG